MKNLLVFILSFFLITSVQAQFVENFDRLSFQKDQTAVNGWAYYSGDGVAAMDFSASLENNYSTITVDATEDKLGIWWALIKHRVSQELDLEKLARPEFELKIEAKLRSNTYPRRVNLHVNTQRTTDFHSHLKEYDLPDSSWHTISMTTNNFQARPDDSVYVQMAMMDWGFDTYKVDIDYLNVEVVNANTAASDLGNPIPYHPQIPEVNTFGHHVKVAQNGMVDTQYREMNFSSWQTENSAHILNVSGTQYVILRWDFDSELLPEHVTSGVLELSTHSLQRASKYEMDFGIIRVVEVLDGDADWMSKDVTFQSLLNGKPEQKVINGQMVIDWPVQPKIYDKTFFTINQAVMQRLVSGKTKGLILKPLGAINASFFSVESGNGTNAPMLHFNTIE